MEDLLKNLDWINSVATIVAIVLVLILVIILKNIYNLFRFNHKAFKMGLALLVLLLAYPLYTAFGYQLEIGFLGNLLILFITVIYKKNLKRIDMREHQWLLPQIIWLSVVTIYIGLMLLNDYWIYTE